MEKMTPRSERVVMGKNQFLKLLKGISSPPANRMMAAKSSTAMVRECRCWV